LAVAGARSLRLLGPPRIQLTAFAKLLGKSPWIFDRYSAAGIAFSAAPAAIAMDTSSIDPSNVGFASHSLQIESSDGSETGDTTARLGSPWCSALKGIREV
jgi:hypothetical protein